jgi:streptogramin lyase
MRIRAAVLAVLGALAGASPAGAAPGDMTYYDIPNTPSTPSDQHLTPYAVTVGPDGKIWFADAGQHTGGASVGRMLTDGTITTADVFSLPTQDLAGDIEPGPEGKLWVRQGTHVSKVPVDLDDTSDIQGWTTMNSGGWGHLTPGPDGRVWFSAANYVGAITTAGDEDDYYSGYTEMYTHSVRGLVSGPDGKIWFANDLQVRRMSTSGVVNDPGDVFPLPSGHQNVTDMTLGPDGNFWLTLGTAEIARLTPAGSFTFFPTPTTGSLPFGIYTGPDGLMWFAESNGNAVASIPTDATSGADIKEYPLNVKNSNPLDIVAGPDKRMWVPLFNEHQLVAVETNVAPASPPPPGDGPPPQQPSPTPPGPGPGTPPGPPPPRVPAACAADRLVLTDVFPAAGRTRVLGVAPASAVGKQVEIRSTWNGKRVARPVVAADFTFEASVPLPPRRLRTANRTRYVAVLGGVRSQALKFARRMYTTSIAASGNAVRFAGVVTKPLASPARPVVLRASATCAGIGRGAVLASVKPSRSGAFSASLTLPPQLASAPTVFLRAQTKVPKQGARRRKLFATFTLIRGIRTAAR